MKKKPSPSETPNIKVVRKSIVAIQPIKKGEIFTENNLSVKRPAGGINPMRWDEILGKKAYKAYDIDMMIEENL
jgi:N,N'-diacetyllegionaminate synthase